MLFVCPSCSLFQILIFKNDNTIKFDLYETIMHLDVYISSEHSNTYVRLNVNNYFIICMLK